MNKFLLVSETLPTSGINIRMSFSFFQYLSSQYWDYFELEIQFYFIINFSWVAVLRPYSGNDILWNSDERFILLSGSISKISFWSKFFL